MIEHKQRRTSAMDAVEQRLAGLRHQDDAIVGDGPDWAALEAAVLLGLDRRQRQAQMRRQLGWTGALALAAGLAGAWRSNLGRRRWAWMPAPGRWPCPRRHRRWC
jgi:hypothetical protein